MHPDHQFAPIAALDLDPIKVKLMHQESGEGWSREHADAVEFEYRRFLYLMKEFPNEQAAPLFDVDVFWHYHILDTMKYAVDCEAVFGYFLHHFPYVGLRGASDRDLHDRVGARMRELYEQTYGEDYIRPSVPGQTAAIGRIAFSMKGAPVAFSMASNNVAFSMAASNATFSMNTAKVAFSMAAGAVTGAQSDDTLDSDAVTPEYAAAAMVFSVRPSLAVAV